MTNTHSTRGSREMSPARRRRITRAMTRDVKRRLRRMGLGRFARDESGVMVIFAIYIFLMMLIIGGIGIDVMRFERDRTMVQYTLDRAVLAAADLDQQLDPAAVVRDYFEKANIGEYLSEVTVDEGLGYRVVSGSAQTTFV